MDFPENSVIRMLTILSSSILITSMPFLSTVGIIPIPEASAQAILTDFNGDGYEDLAIGVPGEDFGGFTDVGLVTVIYGSSDGLRTSAVSSGDGMADQTWSQANIDIEGGGNIGDQFGFSLTTADFNGDGYSDLAVGVPGEGQGLPFGSAGAVNVIYGSIAGLSATPVSGTGRADQIWTQDSINIEDSADGADLFGSSLASGDFNNDGYDDLAVGAAFEDVGSKQDAGLVNVIYGSSTGLRAGVAGDGTGRTDQKWTQDSPEIAEASEPFDHFGEVLTTGDFNADQFSDLAIGVPFEDIGAINAAGLVNVIYGSSNGLSATPPGDDTGEPDQVWFLNSPFVEGTSGMLEKYGGALAAGDFNSDSADDLAVGVENDNIGGSGGGGVSVIYGSTSGLSATAKPDQLWWQGAAGVNDDPEPDDQFGAALAAGNFNDDIYYDLAIGVPFESVGSADNAGGVNVIYGSSAGLSATGISGTGRADQFWTQDTANIVDSSEENDKFGFAMATGDFNGDDSDDLAIGVHEEDVLGQFLTVPNAGAVSLIYGSNTGLSAAAVGPSDGHDDQIWSQNSAGIEDSAESDDNFGWSLAPPGASAVPA